MSKTVDLLHDKPSKCFFSYLLPTVLSMIAFSCYVIVDVMFVGYYEGSNGLAALSMCLPFFTIYNSIALLLGMGASTTISVMRGRGEIDKVNKVFTMAVITNIVIGILLTTIYTIFTKEVVIFFGADELLTPHAMDYLIPVSMATIFFMLSNMLQVIIRSDGNPRLVMVGTTIANVMNIFLDYILMAKFGMGIMGASIATAISPIITLIIISLHFFKGMSSLSLVKKAFDFAIFKRIVKNGLGIFVLEFSAGIIIYLFNNVLLYLGGAVAVAVYSIISNVQFVGRAIFNGIGQAMQPILSENYGAGKNIRLKEVWKTALTTSLIFSAVYYLFVLIFPSEIAGFFVNNDTEVINAAVLALRLYYSSFIFTGVNTLIMYYCQSVESSKYSTVISVLQGIVFVILGMIILVPMLEINGVWLTVAFAEISTLVFAVKFKCNADKKLSNT